MPRAWLGLAEKEIELGLVTSVYLAVQESLDVRLQTS